jgi:ribosomal protein L7Ae-like RNA K-turn-binding protein
MRLNPKIAALVGFAAKSGTLLSSTYLVEESIKRKRARLVLAAGDMSPKRLEILRLWCGDMDVPFLTVGTKEDYGLALRKKPLGLLALTDVQLAWGIIQAAQANGGD